MSMKVVVDKDLSLPADHDEWTSDHAQTILEAATKHALSINDCEYEPGDVVMCKVLRGMPGAVVLFFRPQEASCFMADMGVKDLAEDLLKPLGKDQIRAILLVGSHAFMATFSMMRRQDVN